MMITAYTVHEAANYILNHFKGQTTAYLYITDRLDSSLLDVRKSYKNEPISTVKLEDTSDTRRQFAGSYSDLIKYVSK